MNVPAKYLPVLALLMLGCASPESTQSAGPPSSQPEAAGGPTAGHTKAKNDGGPAQPAPRNTVTKSKVPANDAPGKSDRVSRPAPTLDELLLFFPSKYPKGNWCPQDLTFEDVWFTADDGTWLHGWYCACEKPRAVLLFAHGNAGNLSDRAPLLTYLQKRMRVTVLIFDYRGYGRSDGVPTADGILRDARAARAFLAKRAAVDEADIVLMGRSLGGAAVVQLAAESPARGLILESTFSSLKDVASHHYPKLAWLVPSGKLNSAAQIARHRGPLLQSHGDADRTIPFSSGQKLFRAANEPKTFVTIHDGDHNHPQTAEYYQQLDRFLDSLPPTSAPNEG